MVSSISRVTNSLDSGFSLDGKSECNSEDDIYSIEDVASSLMDSNKELPMEEGVIVSNAITTTLLESSVPALQRWVRMDDRGGASVGDEIRPHADCVTIQCRASALATYPRGLSSSEHNVHCPGNTPRPNSPTPNDA